MSSAALPHSQRKVAGGETAIGALEVSQLRQDFPGEGMGEVIQMFMEEGRLVLDRMELALERQDGQALRRAAHALRGSGANFGARALDALCQKIEVRALRGDFAAAGVGLKQVREEYRRVEAALDVEGKREV